MAGPASPDVAAGQTKKRKTKHTEFERGKPRTTPCKLCVDNQLRYFETGEWKNTCCDQTTKKGSATSCYQCRVAKKTCESFEVDDDALKRWAAVQREPEEHDDETALDRACDMRLYLLRSTEPMTTIQKCLFESLSSAKDTAETMIAAAEDCASKLLDRVGAGDEEAHARQPVQPSQRDATPAAQQAAEDDVEKKCYPQFAHLDSVSRGQKIDDAEKEYPKLAHLDSVSRKEEIDKAERDKYPHLRDMDVDHRKQLIQLSKCRKPEDALSMAQKIITTASGEVRECLEDVRHKV